MVQALPPHQSGDDVGTAEMARRRPKPDRRRAALNCWRHAGTAARKKVMLAHGFDIPLMVELVRDGLATARPERLRAGKVEMEIARVRITEAGRREHI